MSTSKTHYLDQLNSVQRDAVTAMYGPVMVVAGPGSGKTRVLTYRVAHLIENGIAPWNILCLTFTNKAAREMQDRIEKVVGPSARRVWAGTFHSIFARILRVEAKKIGFPSDFTIYDTDDSKSLISDIIKSMALDRKTYTTNNVLSRISSAKSSLITPKLYIENTELREHDAMNKMPMIYEIYGRYVRRCFISGAMDFDDLLLQMYRLLYENKDKVRDKYRAAFSFVMVDEFQDTNYLQYAIVKELVKYPESAQNICIVGDDAQSIYSFRGATIENILQFEQDFNNTQVFKLEQNYRSTKHIVDSANQLISFNKFQIKKKIWTEDKDGSKIRLFKLVSDAEEGRRVIDRIMELKHRQHIHNKEIAILYRTNSQSRVFEENLRKQNIDYKVFGGLSFYQRKEVKDLLAYLRLAVNPKDDEALKRAINYPRRGIGNTTISKLLAFATDANESMWDAIHRGAFKGRAQNLMNDFAGMIHGFVKKTQHVDAHSAALFMAQQSGLISLLKADISMEGVNRYQNLVALLDGIKDFTDSVEEGEKPTLALYLQSISLLTDFDKEEISTDFVSLMSVHASKGLEYDAVFVVGLEENLFPSFMSMHDPKQIDEERRLFYVAITRARRFLCLSYCHTRYQYGKIRMNDPSRFLSEIPPEAILDEVQKSNRLPIEPRKVHGLQPHKRVQRLKQLDIQNFRPSPPHLIKSGMRILHRKFGKGKIQAIDGTAANKMATVIFDDMPGTKKVLVLKFARLQILEDE